jgi:hypothetical protein
LNRVKILLSKFSPFPAGCGTDRRVRPRSADDVLARMHDAPQTAPSACKGARFEDACVAVAMPAAPRNWPRGQKRD